MTRFNSTNSQTIGGTRFRGKPRIGRIAFGAMMATAAPIALGLSTAQADSMDPTFDFGIVYDIQSPANFTSAFPGAATSQFTGGGAYEETNTTTKTVAKVGTGATPTLTTEFVQNASPSQQLVFTSFGTNPSAIFAGFPLSGTNPPNASSWQYVQTLSTTAAGFTYQVGGVGTPFALNSIGLANTQSCNCSTGVTIEGFLGGVQVATQTVGIPGNFVGGNGNTGVPASVDIFTLTGFADVDTIKILPGANVNVNDISISSAVAVPGPVVGAGLPGLIAACGGLVAFARRRRHLVVGT